jgi:hypothetical protein
MNQNNRIPSVIHDFAEQPEVQDVLSFLSFKDWLAQREAESKDWVIVARVYKDDSTDLFTFSVMASRGSVKRLLSKPDWDVYLDFGKPYFYTGMTGKVVYHNPEMGTEINGIKFRPFVIYRYFHGFIPNTFELVQNFILYHEAFFVSQENEYRFIDENGELQTLARIKKDNNNHLVLVDAHYLKDYLAANRCCLVRYHDHMRYAVEDISRQIKRQFKSTVLRDKLACFKLLLRTDMLRKEYRSASCLFGKDIVLPYPNPIKPRNLSIIKDKKKFATFIIGQNEQGENIEVTCNPDELSNYFTDRGNPHFLTPIFFKREVLQKYYDEPSRYKVNGSSVKCLDLWLLRIDTTEEGLIQTWLGDLGGIPYKEQLHWRQFNVPPKGKITKHRWLHDFMAEFAEPAGDPIYNFRVAFEEVQKATKTIYGEELFRELDQKDRYAYETLHLPLTEEWKEFDEQTQALAKFTIDSLNVDLLSRESGKRINGTSIKGSLDLLEAFLNKKGISTEYVKRILLPLRIVQTIRSTGAAHRKGSKFYDQLKRFQLANISNREKMKKIL